MTFNAWQRLASIIYYIQLLTSACFMKIVLLFQCLQHRALEPHEPLPELSPMIANSLNPPQEVSARCEAQCEKLKNLFKLEKVKKEDRKTGENMFKQK